jgi:two-component system, NarL family, response regulator DevR
MQRGSVRPARLTEYSRGGKDASQQGTFAGTSLTVKVLLVSPFSLSRHVLRMLLEVDETIEVIGDTGSVQESLGLVKAQAPHVVVMETADGAPRDLDAFAAMSSAHPTVRLLLIAMDFSPDHQLRALRAGISAYLPMSIEPKLLRQAVRAVHAGQTVVHDQGTGASAPSVSPQSTRRPSAMLTPREIEVIRRLAEGLTDKQIAARLSMAASTVKIHLRAVYHKLGIHNRAQAVVYAASNELLDGEVGGAPYPFRIAPT